MYVLLECYSNIIKEKTNDKVKKKQQKNNCIDHWSSAINHHYSSINFHIILKQPLLKLIQVMLKRKNKQKYS